MYSASDFMKLGIQIVVASKANWLYPLHFEFKFIFYYSDEQTSPQGIYLRLDLHSNLQPHLAHFSFITIAFQSR